MRYCTTCQGRFPVEVLQCPKDSTLLATVGEFVPGKIIREKYEVQECIGSGGMAVVYRARHVAFKEEVALKVVSSRLLSDDMFLKRFRTEAVITRKLRHPNAVRVDDLDSTEDGRPFIVMELVAGESLRSAMRHGGPLGAARSLDIACQIVAALGAAHDLGIIHRDIKPDNVLLVSKPDGKDFVKVLDFGIARIRDAREQGIEQTETHTGMVMGTPQYLSPEQAVGAKGDAIDGRADFYSLGLVLYEMLTGAPPFQADNGIGMLIHHIHSVPKPPHLMRPDLQIPHMVSALVMKALEKDRNLRFATAKDFLSALQHPETWSETAVLGSDSVAALTGEEPKQLHRAATAKPGDSTHRDEDAEWIMGQLAAGAEAAAFQQQYEESLAHPEPPRPAPPRPVEAAKPTPPRPNGVARTPTVRPHPEPLKQAKPAVVAAASRAASPSAPSQTVFAEPAQRGAAQWKMEVDWQKYLAAAAIGLVILIAGRYVFTHLSQSGSSVSSSGAAALSDDDVAANVRQTLAQSDPLRGQTINVLADHGNVTLQGHVDIAYKSEIASRLAALAPGVRSVDNQLQIREGPIGSRGPQRPANAAGLEDAPLARAGVAQQMSAQELVDAGNRALATGNNRLALEDFKRAAAINPNDSQAQAGIMRAMGKK